MRWKPNTRTAVKQPENHLSPRSEKHPSVQILQALALLALYFLAVGISALHERHVRRRVAATDVPDAHGLPSGSQ